LILMCGESIKEKNKMKKESITDKRQIIQNKLQIKHRRCHLIQIKKATLKKMKKKTF